MPNAIAAIPATLGHYRIVEKIGAGGMGEVYLATDEHLSRHAAIKVLPSGTIVDEVARRRFQQEALALSRLNHANIETIFDFDTDQGVDYLVAEYIPGSSVDTLLARGPLPQKDVLRLGTQLADGLSAAHDAGVIHRDLKPANLRVTSDSRLKILDFGLAKLVEPDSRDARTESLSVNPPFSGTLPYMAPEQVHGDRLDARTDIWAAGAVLYEMATGRRPFAGVGLHVIDEILHRSPATPSLVNPKLSAELESIILKCLDKDPDARYQHAKELAVDLRRLSTTASWKQPSSTTIPERPRAARFWFLALAIVLALALATAAALWFRSHTAVPSIRSVAVLPLANMSGDTNQDYFADGMTDALITRLSQINALRVLSRTSVLQYKGTTKSVPQIARELNVDAIVEGSVLRVGDRVRITAQLVAANPERHLWAEDYDRDFKNILQVHSDVSQAIARQIRVHLTPAEQQTLGQSRPVDPEAHDAYLRGRYLGTRFSAAPLEQARQYLGHAVDKDPTYAPAWAELAHVYIKLSGTTQRRDPQLLINSKSAATKALEIDPDLAQAHMVLAIATAFLDGDLRLAMREAERALQLGPNSADILMHATMFFVIQHRSDEAVAMVDRALQLEPLDFEINHLAAQAFFLARRYDRAIDQAHKALELDPNSAATYQVLANIYEAKHDDPQTITASEKAMELSGAPSGEISSLRHAFTTQGMHGVYVWRLAQLDRAAAQGGATLPVTRAGIYASMGDRERALQLLEQAAARHDPTLIAIAVNYRFDSLRSDPRFRALLANIGAPE